MTFVDELESQLFLRIAPSKQPWFDDRTLFGSEVEERFPSARLDIEEAGKCYAAGRNTACVLHLMRVLERGLDSLARALDVKMTVPGWGPILKKVDTELAKKFNQKTPDWKANEQFFAECAALLRNVQYAWRNPFTHVEHIYTDERALEVLQAARSFMKHLSKELREIPFPPSAGDSPT